MAGRLPIISCTDVIYLEVCRTEYDKNRSRQLVVIWDSACCVIESKYKMWVISRHWVCSVSSHSRYLLIAKRALISSAIWYIHHFCDYRVHTQSELVCIDNCWCWFQLKKSEIKTAKQTCHTVTNGKTHCTVISN